MIIDRYVYYVERTEPLKTHRTVHYPFLMQSFPIHSARFRQRAGPSRRRQIFQIPIARSRR